MTTPAHGTVQAYHHHLRQGTPACQKCLDANAERARNWRKSGGSNADSGRRPMENVYEPSLSFGEWARENGYDVKTRTYGGAS